MIALSTTAFSEGYNIQEDKSKDKIWTEKARITTSQSLGHNIAVPLTNQSENAWTRTSFSVLV